MAQQARTEFSQAIRAIASERKLDPDVILETIRQAIIAAYKRDAKEAGIDVEEVEFEVKLDPVSGEARVFSIDPENSEEKKDVTPPGFGRIAAQTAKQVIHQKIREAEKGAIMDEYTGRVGSLISGMILRFEGSDVRVDLGRAEGIMPAEERVPTERLNPNQRMSFLLKSIEDNIKGKRIMLSRADAQFVQKLFEREVPEMSTGSVEVKAIVREPGVRTKMAVVSNQSGVDPVGSCVGQKGVRVQTVTNELGGERVDIIPWSDNDESYIEAALAPAEGLTVITNEKEKLARVKAPEEQLSMAIGKDGQNARLAAKLTGWKIEVESIEGEKTSEKKSKKEKESGEDEVKDEKTDTKLKGSDELTDEIEKIVSEDEIEKNEDKDGDSVGDSAGSDNSVDEAEDENKSDEDTKKGSADKSKGD